MEDLNDSAEPGARWGAGAGLCRGLTMFSISIDFGLRKGLWVEIVGGDWEGEGPRAGRAETSFTDMRGGKLMLQVWIADMQRRMKWLEEGGLDWCAPYIYAQNTSELDTGWAKW